MSGSITGGFSPKDPDDTDLFAFDVTAVLDPGETVVGTPAMLSEVAPTSAVRGTALVTADVAVTVTPAGVPPAMTLASVVVSGVVSGGTLGATYVLSVEFTTSGGRTIRRGRSLFVTRC